MYRYAPLIVCLFLSLMFARVARAADTPNVVIIFCDDMGWGDVGCFGNPTIRTPNIDRMAAEGQKWTQFYAAAPICTPSRAGLLTGRLPIRNGMTSPKRVVLFPDSGGGLPQEEVTLAELLKQKNYATGMFGKWHLGHLPQYLPIAQGFDEYIGIPYSNDMDRIAAAPNYHKEAWNDARYRALSEHYNVPLMNGEKIIERPADQDHITRRYTTEAVRYIREHKDGPFFLYLAHNMPHIPLFASERFRDKSIRGLFGDVVEELDWSVGQVLDTLRELKIEKKTLVMFCSDNGPWLVFGTHGGSAGPLRAGKGTCWEGGQREPTIFWWPGTIEAGSEVTGMGCTTDMMATIAALTGTQMPNDRKMDSLDLSPTLLGKAPSPRHQMYYWTRGDLHAVRDGAWKLHIKVRDPMNYGRVEVLKKPELYNVEVDISEKFDVADKNPEIVQRLLKMIEDHKADIEPHEDMLAIPLKK